VARLLIGLLCAQLPHEYRCPLSMHSGQCLCASILARIFCFHRTMVCSVDLCCGLAGGSSRSQPWPSLSIYCTITHLWGRALQCVPIRGRSSVWGLLICVFRSAESMCFDEVTAMIHNPRPPFITFFLLVYQCHRIRPEAMDVL